MTGEPRTKSSPVSRIAPKTPARTAKSVPVSPTPPTPRRSIDDFSQDELVEALVRTAPRKWIERKELLKLAAAKLGFARVGSSIRARFKSAFTGAIRRGLFEYEGSQVRPK